MVCTNGHLTRRDDVDVIRISNKSGQFFAKLRKDASVVKTSKINHSPMDSARLVHTGDERDLLECLVDVGGERLGAFPAANT